MLRTHKNSNLNPGPKPKSKNKTKIQKLKTNEIEIATKTENREGAAESYSPFSLLQPLAQNYIIRIKSIAPQHADTVILNSLQNLFYE